MSRADLCPLVYFEGVDGSGKSTTAQEVAAILSEEYAEIKIGVSDSDGLNLYKGGELITKSCVELNRLIPDCEDSRLRQLAKLGSFTLGRRRTDKQGMSNVDLLIGVRDPHRIEPASYIGTYLKAFQKMSPLNRLLMFDSLSKAPYADSVIHINAEPEEIDANISERVKTNPHETAHELTRLGRDLLEITHQYGRMFGARAVEVEGLRPSTTGDICSVVEPLLSESHERSVALP